MASRITQGSGGGGSCIKEAHTGQSWAWVTWSGVEHRLLHCNPSVLLTRLSVGFCYVPGTILSPSSIFDSCNHPNNLMRKVLVVFPITRQGTEWQALWRLAYNHTMEELVQTAWPMHWVTGSTGSQGPPGKQAVLCFKIEPKVTSW